MNVDFNKINELVRRGYINVVHHERLPLRIYNYTRQCQYEWFWTPETIVCRGLIVDNDDNIVARPFPKFFTPDQYRALRCKFQSLYGIRYKDLYQGGFQVTEKLDGSLGVLYTDHNGVHRIATRGSFYSEQAEFATSLYNLRYLTNYVHPGVTYLFEVIYPGNRVVIDYGDKKDLVLLAVVDNETGRDRDDVKEMWTGPKVNHYHFSSVDDVLQHTWGQNEEGCVVRFDSGIRVKIKSPEYLRLHKLMTGTSERRIWEMLRDGETLDKVLNNVPDDFCVWMSNVVKRLWDEYHTILDDVANTIEREVDNRNPPLSRKQIAMKYADYKYRAVLFAMLDCKQYEQAIWKLVKP
jgi:RNA ligase